MATNRFTGIDYQTLQQHNDECGKHEVDAELLIEIVLELSESSKRKIAKRLERARKHFSHERAPGAILWYPRKLAACARFDDLMNDKRPTGSDRG